jgi:hypothetical protein
MVDGLSREKDMQSQVNPDQRQVIHQVRGRSARTPLNAINVCAENHSPKELQLESLQQVCEVLLNESRGRDLA